MYERNETKITTSPDGTSSHHKITERSKSGVGELFLIPTMLTFTAVTCWLIIKVGVQVGNVVNELTGTTPSGYVVRE